MVPDSSAYDGTLYKRVRMINVDPHILDESAPEKFKKKRPQADVSQIAYWLKTYSLTRVTYSPVRVSI